MWHLVSPYSLAVRTSTCLGDTAKTQLLEPQVSIIHMPEEEFKPLSYARNIRVRAGCCRRGKLPGGEIKKKMSEAEEDRRFAGVFLRVSL